jgi:hypothetical protein
MQRRTAGRTPRRFARFAGIAACAIGGAALPVGCGVTAPIDFPHQLVGADGTRITLEQVEEIVNDPDLDEPARRNALRDLGIEDEKLIDALLTL